MDVKSNLQINLHEPLLTFIYTLVIAQQSKGHEGLFL